MNYLLPLISYSLYMPFNFALKKNNAWDRAVELSGEKGIANLGCGGNDRYDTAFARKVRESPQVVVNIDKAKYADIDNIQLADLEYPLPFGDKQFDVAFSSHVLEHLKNWRQALDEWTRIANHVVIVLPNPLSLGGHMNADHYQHFSFGSIEQIRREWGVEVYT